MSIVAEAIKEEVCSEEPESIKTVDDVELEKLWESVLDTSEVVPHSENKEFSHVQTEHVEESDLEEKAKQELEEKELIALFEKSEQIKAREAKKVEYEIENLRKQLEEALLIYRKHLLNSYFVLS